jgi:hypothetical protein
MGIVQNDDVWRTAYNRALAQIILRRDTKYEQVHQQTPWSKVEQYALHLSINRWCKVKGVHNFLVNTLSLTQQVAADINRECHERDKGSYRNLDMVRSQIMHSAQGRTKRNPLITEPANRATQTRVDISNVKTIVYHDMYSEDANKVPGLSDNDKREGQGRDQEDDEDETSEFDEADDDDEYMDLEES